MSRKRLLIIADDFTGAMDTSVHFAGKGANVLAVSEYQSSLSCLNDDEEVLVINSNSRHMQKEEAYNTVYRIVKDAVAAGFSFIYKKTDSALRGNIGAELSALSDATGKSVVFIPAYPKLGRTTKDGIHYINGIPVAESVFAEDLFNPVTSSSVKEIIGQQAELTVSLHPCGSIEYDSFAKINVYDAETKEDMKSTAKLDCDKLCISAGCGGFASVLADTIGIEEKPTEEPCLVSSLLAICGSTNPVTIAQLDFAQRKGISRVNLLPEEKLDEAFCLGGKYKMQLSQWTEIMHQERFLILDANDPAGSNATAKYCEEKKMSLEFRRTQIVKNLSVMLKDFLDRGIDTTLFCTGGDTLKAVIHELGVNKLKPLKELYSGVVLAELEYKKKKYNIITKSGGFGCESLLGEIIDRLMTIKTESEKNA